MLMETRLGIGKGLGRSGLVPASQLGRLGGSGGGRRWRQEVSERLITPMSGAWARGPGRLGLLAVVSTCNPSKCGWLGARGLLTWWLKASGTNVATNAAEAAPSFLIWLGSRALSFTRRPSPYRECQAC